MFRSLASTTAQMTALFRALEMERPTLSRLLEDPFARYFLSAPLQALLGIGGSWTSLWERLDRVGQGVATFVVCRHKAMDEGLLRFAQAHSLPTIIVLGAGYDMRSHRLGDSVGKASFLEIDHPSTSGRKQRILNRLHRKGVRFPGIEPRRLSLRLGEQDLVTALQEAGVSPKKPTLVLWEGVTMYLQQEQVQKTLSDLSKVLGPGSEVWFDVFTPTERDGWKARLEKLSIAGMGLIGEPILFNIPGRKIPGFLEPLGFELVELFDSVDLRELYSSPQREPYPHCCVVRARRTV